ncbi:MAG: hypothetical protein KZQ56_13120 [gamma proteobacterium symbiont of Lucinoma myriamae]|nr:hypothetical protein [gamma proteobacterium symbiont of Lucinoma myriamae]MCU7833492.1 hypothetical protein [gamma proteobacterium symbiont of Lucinoma myriamae]
MAKVQQNFTAHFELAKKKARDLGYFSLLQLDREGTDEHKLLIQSVYRQSVLTLSAQSVPL